MKKQINYKKEFIEFLRERDLITTFCAGLACPKWYLESDSDVMHNGLTLTSYINQNANEPRNWIFKAFHWAQHKINSPKREGHEYWNNIDNEWRHYLSHLND